MDDCGNGGAGGGGGTDPTTIGGGFDPNAGNLPLQGPTIVTDLNGTPADFAGNTPVDVNGSTFFIVGPNLVASGDTGTSFADQQLQAIAPGIVSGAGVIGDTSFVVGFYGTSALAGAAASAGALAELGASLNEEFVANFATWQAAGAQGGFPEAVDIFMNATSAPGAGVTVTGAGWGAAQGLMLGCLIDPNSPCH